MNIYDASKMPGVVAIGYDGENNWRPQSFDCASLLENHPNGTLTLWILPHSEEQAFPVALSRNGNVITWTPLSEELAGRGGALQIVCTDSTDVGKSAIALYRVSESVIPGAEHPAAVPSWATQTVERAEAAADRAEEAAASIDLEHLEQTISEAVEDYLEEHPVQAPVTSVNGKTGAVRLNASDVGALPSDTVIPPAVTEQDVAGWGFTKNTGTYSKPSGGIPASDLASGVIPAVPQMATQTDMSDWTSGKTVDAAALKVDFSFASQELGGLLIAVDELQTAVSQKADSVDIPTKTSDLTNDSGFQTAAQVQSAIAAIPDELPAVTSSDNGKFLRVVSGSWVAATVPIAEEASF